MARERQPEQQGEKAHRMGVFQLLMLLATQRIKPSLMLSVMQASNSYRGFESLLLRQRGRELPLRARMRRE